MASDAEGGEAAGSTQGKAFVTIKPQVDDAALLDLLEARDVTVNAEPTGGPGWAEALIGLLPWILIIGLMVWFARRMQQRLGGDGEGPGGMFGCGKIRGDAVP